jgi:hypothetical protein
LAHHGPASAEMPVKAIPNSASERTVIVRMVAASANRTATLCAYNANAYRARVQVPIAPRISPNNRVI